MEESVVQSGLWIKSSLKKWIPKDVIEKKASNNQPTQATEIPLCNTLEDHRGYRLTSYLELRKLDLFQE